MLRNDKERRVWVTDENNWKLISQQNCVRLMEITIGPDVFISMMICRTHTHFDFDTHVHTQSVEWETIEESKIYKVIPDTETDDGQILTFHYSEEHFAIGYLVKLIKEAGL